MRKQLKKIRILQNITGCTLFFTFFIILAGTVGSLELDRIGLVQGLIQMGIGFAISGVCVLVMKYLDDYEDALIDAIARADYRAAQRRARWDHYFKTGRI